MAISLSETAAKEIKGLIQDSVRKVQDGSLLVTQSGQTLEQIVSSVKKVSDIVAEIAAASREQSSGIEQVNRAVMQMDELTQQNAALVEQATAASQAMADQARELNEMMNRYRVRQTASDRREHGQSALAAAAPASDQSSPAVAGRSGGGEAQDRRRTTRPWKERDSKPAEAPPKATRRLAANGAESDSDWKEF